MTLDFAKAHPATIDSIIKCSNAILYLTIQKCDFDHNQNYVSLFIVTIKHMDTVLPFWLLKSHGIAFSFHQQFFQNVLELTQTASLLLVGETPKVSKTPLGSVITAA